MWLIVEKFGAIRSEGVNALTVEESQRLLARLAAVWLMLIKF